MQALSCSMILRFAMRYAIKILELKNIHKIETEVLAQWPIFNLLLVATFIYRLFHQIDIIS